MKRKLFSFVATIMAAAAIITTPAIIPSQKVEASADNYFMYDDYLEVDDFRASSRTKNSITLKWNKTYLADGYQVYRYNTNTRKWKRLTTTTKRTYKVKNLKSNTIYRFRIRAFEKVNKKKIYGEWEYESFTTRAKSSKKDITVEQAKSIALSHANLTAADVPYIKCETDYEYGVMVYEIEFNVGFWEYSYEINASNGEIISWEREFDD